jgi:hypothetical protein
MITNTPGSSPRVAFWIEFVLSTAATLLGLLALVWRDWIEGVFGVYSDHNDGSVEWILVIACLVIGASFGALARRQWHRTHPLAA